MSCDYCSGKPCGCGGEGYMRGNYCLNCLFEKCRCSAHNYKDNSIFLGNRAGETVNAPSPFYDPDHSIDMNVRATIAWNSVHDNLTMLNNSLIEVDQKPEPETWEAVEIKYGSLKTFFRLLASGGKEPMRDIRKLTTGMSVRKATIREVL